MTPDPAAQPEETPLDRLAQRIAEEIREDRLDLPGFPEAVLRVQRTMQSADSGADDVVKVLSSEPALAARALRIANSVQFRRAGSEVTDLRTAVSRLGFDIVRSIAVAYAIQHLRMREHYSASARVEIESIWRCSLNVASACYVLAKHGGAGVNADHALIVGLLHVIGRLYIVMHAEGIGATPDAELAKAADTHQGEISRLILANWGLPESLQHAVQHQDDLAYAGDRITTTDVLIAAKWLAVDGRDESVTSPVLERLAAAAGKPPAEIIEEHAAELKALTSSLME